VAHKRRLPRCSKEEEKGVRWKEVVPASGEENRTKKDLQPRGRDLAPQVRKRLPKRRGVKMSTEGGNRWGPGPPTRGCTGDKRRGDG